MITPLLGPPGFKTLMQAVHRAIFSNKMGERYLPGGVVIDGAKSGDPGNTGDVRKLRAGLVMGKITASGKYAPSIIGVTGEALDDTETTMTVSEAVGDEIVRRIGASGTLKITGPATAGGTVRTLTMTYSSVDAAGGGNRVVNYTALGVNEVQTLNFTNSPSGTFRLGIVDYNGKLQYTQPITYSATPATLVSNINTAIDAVLASGAVVASGSAVTAIALTFSGTNYLSTAQTNLVTIDTDALTAGDVDITRTTAGVDGDFIAGSFLGSTDGSHTPMSFLPCGFPLLVNYDSVDYDVEFPALPIAGTVESDQLVNWPSDTSLRAWLIAALKVNCNYVFTSVF